MRLMNPHRAEGVLLRFSRLRVLWRDRCAADRARPLPETCEWRRVLPRRRIACGSNFRLAFTPIVDCRCVMSDQRTSQVGSESTRSDFRRKVLVERRPLLSSKAKVFPADLCNAKRLIASDSSQCSVAVLENGWSKRDKKCSLYRNGPVRRSGGVPIESRRELSHIRVQTTQSFYPQGERRSI